MRLLLECIERLRELFVLWLAYRPPSPWPYLGYNHLYHGCNNRANQISWFEVIKLSNIILICTSRQFMFTVDLDDCQWLQCMFTQIPNAFTMNKVDMNADVVVNGGASCDIDVRFCSLSAHTMVDYS